MHENEFLNFQDVINQTNGGEVLFATDDFFAIAENLIENEEPVWRDGVYTEYGKWMDGWETRRKRKPGHDFCILKMVAPAVLYGVNVNTKYFTGNHAPCISIQASNDLDPQFAKIKRTPRMGNEAADLELQSATTTQNWQTILEATTLSPGYPGTCNNFFSITSEDSWQYLRLNLFPDGGVARLRVYGKVKSPDTEKILKGEEIDLCSFANGGQSIAFSNAHFGHPKNLIGYTKAKSMADGWETARCIDRPRILEEFENGFINYQGSEWCTLQLGVPGKITKIIVDTSHFKGNYPDMIAIDGSNNASEDEAWQPIVPLSKLKGDKEHNFQCNSKDSFEFIKITIIPDGGISRIKVYGIPTI